MRQSEEMKTEDFSKFSTYEDWKLKIGSNREDLMWGPVRPAGVVQQTNLLRLVTPSAITTTFLQPTNNT